MSNLLKSCSTCKQQKPLSEFGVLATRRDGLNGTCKVCNVQRSREYVQRNQEKRKAYEKQNNLKRYYGLTQEQFDMLFAKQDGRCAICGRKPEGNVQKAICVDHDHATNAVRGLLCGDCNKALGLFNDDVNLLQQAIQYLQNHTQYSVSASEPTAPRSNRRVP